MSDGLGRRRVGITGMGAVTPCGLDAEQTWQSVREGRSGVSAVEGFEGHVRIAAQVKGFEPERYMEHRSVRKTDRFAQFAVAAATMAVEDAGIDIRADAERIGCSIGTGIGGLKTEEVAHRKLFEAGPDRLNPFWVTALIPNMGAAEISMALGTRGPLTTEAPVVPLGLGGFGTMRALSRRNDDPEGASRPFDLGRDGFILAEGGAVLVIEELERARARGARIYAEMVGYGMSSDAHHVTEPDPVGGNPARAMRNAMVDGGVTPEMIAYVNAHGTSTPAGDTAETKALKLALGEERAYQIPTSSTKSETGHLLGAAGALETIITALAMRDSFVPPTINQTDPDPDCDLDYVPNTGRAADVPYALTNSFGFGGHNAVIVLRRWDADAA